MNKAQLGRLVHPVLLFVVEPVCKALRVPPVREVQPAKRALKATARLVMPAQLVLKVPPGSRAQPEQLALVAPH